MIRDQQWDVAWRNFVHEEFRGKASKTAERQRRLVLDLSARQGSSWVAKAELRIISPRVAEAYATKTEKTLARDVNALERMGLVLVDSQHGVRAARERILAFLPLAVQAPGEAPAG